MPLLLPRGRGHVQRVGCFEFARFHSNPPTGLTHTYTHREQLHHKGIWLHAWRYEGRTWKYQTPTPAWAQGFAKES